jgi:LysR family transcriptional regulator, low CO2-responsive transcriptional regulator
MEDVHHLRVFISVAENMSFTRAAERLFLTQSAVSHQIARLEREIGADLFVRLGKSISLTPAGQALLPHARKIFSSLDEAAAVVRRATHSDLGRLRIGASPAACQYIIPEALREFRESFPNYSLTIVPGDSPAIIELLLNESIDLGLVIKPERQKKLQFHDLFRDELGFVVSPLHPWVKAGKVDRRELRDQRMVLYSRNSATFRLVDRYLTRMGAPLREWIELGETGAIKELVKLGLGISIMAHWIVRPELSEKSLAFLPLSGGTLRRFWCLASLAGRDLSVAEQTFAGLCQSVGAQLANPTYTER